MDDYRELRALLRKVDLYYEDFEHGIISYLKMPGNAYKQKMIEEYIIKNPSANASDITEYMLDETGFWESYAEYRTSQNVMASAVG